MATLAQALAFARSQSQSDSNGLTDANGIVFANEALYDFRRRMLDKNVDALGIQEAYRDASVPTAGNGSTFLYPTDMFFLKAIEVNYRSTNQTQYQTAQQVDVSNLSGQNSFSWLRTYGDRLTPQFDDRGDWFEVFPTFTGGDNLSQAIRILYFKNPTEFTGVTDTISYPESLDYRILGWRIASNYYYSLNKFTEGDAFNARYEDRVAQLCGTLARGTQQPIQATPIPLNGFEF